MGDYYSPPDGDRDLESSCWGKTTPFQMVLILVLFVVVPFFIVMVSVYLAFLFAWNKSEECIKMCEVIEHYELSGKNISSYDDPDRRNHFKSARDWALLPSKWFEVFTHPPEPTVNATTPSTTTTSPAAGSSKKPLVKREVISNNGTIKTIVEINSEPLTKPRLEVIEATQSPLNLKRKKNTTKRSIPQHCSDHQPQYPTIAALIELLYADDMEEQVLKCGVAILSKRWALTINECIGNLTTKAAVFALRINSNYWSKGGMVLAIAEIVSFKELIALRLKKSSVDNACISSAKVPKNNLKIKIAHAFIWEANLIQPLRKRSKFDPLRQVDVKFDDEATDRTISNGFSTPLLGSQSHVVGFLSREGKILQLDMSKYWEWLYYLVYQQFTP